MPIEKSIGGAPKGLELDTPPYLDKDNQEVVESLLELEIDDPSDPDYKDPKAKVSVTPNSGGGLDVDFDPSQGGDVDLQALKDAPHDANLAALLPSEILDKVGQQLIEDIESDRDSLSEWSSLVEDGMDLLGFRLDDETSFPFEGACTATHPLLAESIIKYQAKARSLLLPPQGPAHTKINGPDEPILMARAKRVRDWLNHQITVRMTEYNAVHDRMLFTHAFMGFAVTKCYWDAVLGRTATRLVRMQDFLVDYYATDLDSAERYTEIVRLTRSQYAGLVASGQYIDAGVEVGVSPNIDIASGVREKEDEIVGREKPYLADKDTYEFYEVHCLLSEEDMGLVPDEIIDSEENDYVPAFLPFIVTIDKQSSQVVSIRRNWWEDDNDRRKIVWYTDWPFIRGFGFYGFGYIHLIGGLSKVSTATLRQLVDAGTFANLQAGFRAHGLRVVGDDNPLAPGEWKEVNAPAQDLTKALLPLPYKEPSQTLVHLLEYVGQISQKFADSTEQVVSESANYGPVGTTMALLEASGKMFSGIHERLYESQSKELRLIASINRHYGTFPYPYPVVGQKENELVRDDFKDIVILPVSDPRSPSEAHRIARTQAQLTIAGQFPQHHNLPVLLTRMHASLGEDDPKSIMAPPPPEIPPMDPVTENLNAMQGLPIKSGLEQDHESHIKVHMTFVQDPNVQRQQQAVQLVMSHIYEHVMHMYQFKMQEALGEQVGMEAQQQTQRTPEQDRALAQKAAEVADQILAETKDMITDLSMESIRKSPQFQLQQQDIDNDTLDVLAKMKESDRDYERQREQMYVTATTQHNVAGVKANAEIEKGLMQERSKDEKSYKSD